MLSLGGSVGDDIDVHGIRVMSGPAHIRGRLGAVRVMGRGRHGGRPLSRGTVVVHWDEIAGAVEKGLCVDRRTESCRGKNLRRVNHGPNRRDK